MKLSKNKYIEIKPHLRLQLYLKCFWSFESGATFLTKQSRPILPDGCIDIIFDLRPSSRQKSFVVGAMTKPITNTRENLIGVRFKPGMAYLFLKHPMNKLTDQIVDFSNFFGNETTLISEQLATLNTLEEQIDLLNQIMIKRLSSLPQLNNQMMFALDYMNKTKGKFNVIELSNHIGWSRQHLTRTCLRYAGLSPKYLSQVLRINNLINEIDNQSPDSLCNLSLSNGFYDQSHMINVFKKITGFPPAKYFN
jgi:AraC-like DNA-binding protein